MALNIVLGGKKTHQTKWCGPIEKLYSFSIFIQHRKILSDSDMELVAI
jgi:hypothetical protein